MKILMIVAKQGFRDEEFDVPFNYFEEKDVNVDVASTESGQCTGKYGMMTFANLSFEDVDIDEYEAVIVVGGPGSRDLVGDKLLEKILSYAYEKKKIIAAICYAPVILAKAGLLKGKKATVWNEDSAQENILKSSGANYMDDTVIVDENIVTARDYKAALEFSGRIYKMIS